MTWIDTLLREPAVQAVGWALLHFVWQGALVGIAAAVALRLLRNSAADVRYVVAAIALALMATLPVVTGVQTWRAVAAGAAPVADDAVDRPGHVQPESSVVRLADDPNVAGACGGGVECAASAVLGIRVEPLLPGLVLVWMTGVALLALRLAGGWFRVQRMKSRGASPADAPLQAIVRRLTKTLHIARPVALLQSSAVEVPTVIGWLKPSVLIPIGALAGLSPLQIEAILAHELAHVRRHDYLVNLLQTVVETLLFYHPAVWWLSHRIRIEREHCCDDLAVSLCGDPVVYARALADLEELRGATSRLVMAATGGSLVARVRRLLAAPATHAGRGPAWLAAAMAVLLMGAIIASPAGRRLDAAEAPLLALADGQAPPAPPAPPTPPTPPSPSGMMHETTQQGSGTITWSHNGEKVVIKYDGAFTFNDTDTDLATMSPGGHLRISDGAWLRNRSVEFTADGQGAITRRFYIGSSERSFEPEGREWLSRIFPKFVRQSGFAAKARVARFLARGGVDAVLGEIARIEGSYSKRLYFAELLKQAPLDETAARRMLEQAGRELDSDYELATLLIAVARQHPIEGTVRAPFFGALTGIGSAYEKRRVLEALVRRTDLSAETLLTAINETVSIGSDYEASQVLRMAARSHPVTGAAREAYLRAAERLGNHEQNEALAALVRASK